MGLSRTGFAEHRQPTPILLSRIKLFRIFSFRITSPARAARGWAQGPFGPLGGGARGPSGPWGPLELIRGAKEQK